MDILDIFFVFVIYITIPSEATYYRNLRRNFRQLDCPPSQPLTDTIDNHAPIISIPPIFYLDEPQQVWVSLGTSQHTGSSSQRSNEVTLQFYFATLEGGHIAGTECHSEDISDDQSYSETTKLEITFPKSAYPAANPEDVYLVTRWCHGVSRCDVWRENRKKVEIRPQTHIVLIQTNKAVFNPEQKVEITVYTIDRHLIPVSTKVELDILGPNGVIHQRAEFLSGTDDRTGVFRTDFQFPPLALHGQWTIRAKHGLDLTQHEEVPITLRNYRLPTFLVDIEMDEVTVLNGQLHDLNPVDVSITARHVFGSAVQGTINCSASYTVSNSNSRESMKGSKTAVEFRRWDKLTLPPDGSLTLQIPLDFLQHTLRTKLDLVTLSFQCNVTECLSGVTEKKTVKTMFKQDMYSIHFDEMKTSFAPDLANLFQAKIKDASDIPASNIRCNVSALNCMTDVLLESHVATSNEQGFISVVLRNVGSPEELCIQVTVIDFGIMATQRLQPRTSETGELISIVPDEDGPNQFSIEASHAYKIKSLYAITYARGTIIEQRRENIDYFRNPHTLRLPSSVATLAPQVDIFVFYVTENVGNAGEQVIVSDRLRMELERYCSEMENVETDKTIYGPGDKLNISFKGYPETTVVSQAIDVAALALGDAGVITREKFQAMLVEHLEGHSANNSSLEGYLTGIVGPHVSPEQPTEAPSEAEPEIPDCCEWAKSQTWNSETSPCTDIANKLLLGNKQSPECISAALECCVEANESGDYDEYYGYDDYLVIDDDPLGGAIVNKGLNGEEVFKPFLATSDEDTSTDNGFRQNFQETIMFPFQSIRHSELSFETQLPDSLTTWEIQSVFLNKHNGLCVPPPTQIQVRKDIFVRVTLPERVVLGEYLEITAIIYNNMDAWFQGYIELHDVSTELCHDTDTDSTQYYPRIPAQAIETVHWVLVPNAIGDHEFSVKLSNSSGIVDAVRMAVHVNHTGFELTQAQDRTILRPRINNSLLLDVPFAAGEDTLTAVIQLDGNIFKPNLESTHTMDRSFLYNSAENSLIHLTSIYYTHKYMESHGSFQPHDKDMIQKELELAMINLLQYMSPTLDCFTIMHSETNMHVCDERLTKYAGLVLLEIVTTDLPHYLDDACSVVMHTFYNTFHTECEKSYLYNLLNKSHCSPDDYVPTDNSEMAAMIERYATNKTMMQLCDTADIGFRILLSRKEQDHFDMLEELLVMWSEQSEGEEQYQNIALKVTEVSTQDVEDASWLLWTAARGDDKAVANALASWMMLHRDAHGAFVTYSDTTVALKALHDYTMMSFEPSSGNDEAKCTAFVENEDGKMEVLEEVDMSDLAVTQSIDVTSALNTNITVQCTKGLTYMQTLVNYHSTEGQTACPLNVTAKVTVPSSGGSVAGRGRGRGRVGRRRAKRAADCTYDPNAISQMRHRYVVEICLDGLLSLTGNGVEETTSFGDSALITVSLFSGYRPYSAYLDNSRPEVLTWEYIPGKGSVVLNVKVPPNEDRFCTKFLKRAESRIDNIQPGLVTVENADRSLQCSTLYHTEDEHPLLDMPSTCGSRR